MVFYCFFFLCCFCLFFNLFLSFVKRISPFESNELSDMSSSIHNLQSKLKNVFDKRYNWVCAPFFFLNELLLNKFFIQSIDKSFKVARQATYSKKRDGNEANKFQKKKLKASAALSKTFPLTSIFFFWFIYGCLKFHQKINN